MMGTFDYQVGRALALQKYAAAKSRCIVTNSDVWRLTRSAPKHRLLPVDVVSLQEDHCHPSSQSRPGKGMVIYECLSAVEAPEEDEWMYQLSAIEHKGRAERQLHDIFCILRDAVPTQAQLEHVRSSLDHLEELDDAPVTEVCTFLQRLLRLAPPYVCMPQPMWSNTPDVPKTALNTTGSLSQPRVTSSPRPPCESQIGKKVEKWKKMVGEVQAPTRPRLLPESSYCCHRNL